MVNPVIVQRSKPYEAEEGCLSLEGTRRTKRFMKIRVRFQDEFFQKQEQEFDGQIAQVIQHECDHLEGILV